MTTDKNDKVSIGEKVKTKHSILTYNPDTNSNTFLDYTEKTLHTNYDKLYEIKTKRGYSIKVTNDHSLITNGSEDFFEKVSPDKALGKFVPVLYSLKCGFKKYKTAKDLINDKHTIELTAELLKYDDMTICAIISLLSVPDKDDEKLMHIRYFNKLEKYIILLLLARLSYFVEKITDEEILATLYKGKQIPENNKLVDAEEVVNDNPANPYLSLPYSWDEIIEVNEVEREEITYDFSVPRYPLFMANGIIVFDTVMVHTPVSAEARQEALDKMLPSKNLFHPRTMAPILMPRQEHIFGFYQASKDIPELRKSNVKAESVMDLDKLLQDIKMGKVKPDMPVRYQGQLTTAGIAIAIGNLPPMLRDYNMVWDKKNITRVMGMLAKQEPTKYQFVVDLFKELGGLYAYKLGSTFKLSDFDLQKLKKMRDAYFSKTDKALAKIDNSNLSKQEKEQRIGEELRKAQAFASNLMEQQTNNTFNRLYVSGAKGSGGQITQILSSPTVVADPKNRLIPSLIHHSYLEGLSPADYFTSSYGTRKGSIAAKLFVAPAGALSKEIMGNTLEVVVSCKECGTGRGLKRDIDDKENVLYRLEAGTNKFIDPNYYEQLKRKGIREVTVRSPATCEAREGVCQHCFGFDEKMQFPEIGENVGVMASQAVSEVISQNTISSKHTAGTAAEDNYGFNEVKAFYNMSSKFSGAAVISEVSGKVSKIEQSATGGMNVFIDKKKYFVPPGRRVTVVLGQDIKAGDPISNGIMPFSKIVPHKGIEQGRQLFIEAANDIYNKAGAHTIKKNLETISRGLINYVEITDPGDFDEYAEGDIVDYNKLMGDLRMHPGKKKPVYHPIQSGTNKSPTFKNDWLDNFGFKFLKQKLIDNAATFSKSPKKQYNPIAPYARGVGFGKGENGKY